MTTKEKTENILRETITGLAKLVPEDLEHPNEFDLMRVISDIKGIYLSIAPTKGETTTYKPVQGAKAIGSEKFRYVVRSGQLVRIGNRENGGEYEQSIDEDEFFEVVAAYQAVLERNPRGRVKATEVFKDPSLDRMPYYQVNLSCSFLWDSKLPQKCAPAPSTFKNMVRDLWNEMQKQS
jgi:hypothetical protein